MADFDPEATRPAGQGIAAELAAAGFDDALVVGRGGFGVVYRCRQRSLGRTVAIKVLSSDLDAENRERFLREGFAMGGLSGHPNIVNILQVGVTSTGRPYIVMPYHPNDSLAVRVRRDGPMPWWDVVRVGVKLAGALETAHRAGTLHRDVKPANILVTEYGEPQLTDFGIARIAGGFETATGAFTGSLAFTAPEVLEGKPPTPASDIYGLGAAMFALITGRAAFERRTGEEIIAQFLRITSQPIPDLRPHGIPDDVCTAIEHAMSVDPARRPATAADFGRELQQVQARHGRHVDDMALPGESRFHDQPTGRHPLVGPVTAGPGTAAPATVTAVSPGSAPPRPNGRPPSSGPPPRSGPPSSGPPSSGPPRPGESPARRTARLPVLLAVLAVALLAVAATAVFVATRQAGDAGTAAAGETTEVAPTAGWRPLRDAPTARQQTAATVADGTVWVFGGLDDSGSSPAHEGYDPAIDTWKSGPDLPIPLNHAMAVTWDGVPVVLGGWIPDGPDLTATASNRVFAVRNGEWVEMPPMPRACAAGAAVTIGDRIYVFGGQADDTLIRPTDVFDGTAWSTVADIPTPREHLAAATDGTYAYALGGRDLAADKNVATVERFDPTTGSWTALPDMPTPRGGLGATYIDGRIVAAGGEEPTRVLADVEAFDLTTGTWSELPDLRTPRHGLALGAVGDTVYAIDGATEPTHAESTSVTEALQIPPRRVQPGPAWRQLRDAPTARQQTAAAVADGTVWVLGGLDNNGSTARVEGYDPAIDTWKVGPDLPLPLNHAMAVEYADELVVLGGWVPEGADLTARPSDRVFALRGGEWAELPAMPQARAAGAAVTIGDRIYVFGGQADDTLLTTTDVYDGSSWSTVADLPTPREHLAATTDGTYAYAVGGRDLAADKNVATVERYDPGTDTWTALPDMPTPRGGLGVTHLDGRIVAAGGEEPTRVLADVEAFDLITGTWSELPPMGVARHGLVVATVGTTVYAVDGAQRPTHAQSTALAEALDFW
ncbi:kelch repeat-containing protein [Rhodococcus ruber]|uniref:Kelch repeat-containing protein n=1 Tax=Rhodococcus ruber TaxID=1830 RepID=UPI0011223A9A|nr:kelch repeat-containing protein [Rhodococcus ruber]QDC12762.1 protein kinase [Rhodococcus ruber]